MIICGGGQWSMHVMARDKWLVVDNENVSNVGQVKGQVKWW